MYSPSDRIDYWKGRWTDGETGFHKTENHPFMSKHVNKLIPNGKANKIFFPLCGKAVDMKWLADQGFTIIGVDGVVKPLKEFFEDHGMEYMVEDVTKVGENVQVYKSKSDNIRLYCCDIFSFTSDFEGTVDAVWDRGSLEALERKDVPKYVQVIKSLLTPRGRILVEVMEYDDSADMKGPPYSMTETELRELFEPEYTVEILEQGLSEMGKNLVNVYYLIVKKS